MPDEFDQYLVKPKPQSGNQQSGNQSGDEFDQYLSGKAQGSPDELTKQTHAAERAAGESQRATKPELPNVEPTGAATRLLAGAASGAEAMVPDVKGVLKNPSSLMTIGNPITPIANAAFGAARARHEGQGVVPSVASGVGSTIGLNTPDIAERAKRGDVAGIIGEAIPSVATTLLAPEVAKGMRGSFAPEVPPGLSEEATANLQEPDVRKGVEKIFQASGPSRTDTGFRETLSKAAPDIAQMSRDTPLKTSGGIINPDFRPREFVSNLSDYMDNLWEKEYKPQIKNVATVKASLEDVKSAMQDTISQVDKEKNPGLVESLQRELSSMPDKESVGDLEKRRFQLSDKLNRYYKATPEQQVAMENQNFNLAATKAEYDAVLKTMDSMLMANGQAGGIGPRGRYGNLAEVRDYVAKQMNPAEESRLAERLSQIFFRRGAERLATGALVNPSVGRQLQSGTRLLGRSSLFPEVTPPPRGENPVGMRLPEVAGPPGLHPAERLGENPSGGPSIFEPQTGKYHDIIAPVSGLETSESSELGRERIPNPWGSQEINYSMLPRDVQPRIDAALQVLRDPTASAFDKARAKGFLSDIGVDTSKEQPVGKRIVRGPR